MFEIQLLDMLLEIEYPLGLKNVPLLEMQGKSLKEFNDDIIQQLLVDPVMRSTNMNGLILFVPLKQALVSIMYESFLDFFLEDVELEVVKVGEKEVLDEEEVLGGKTSPSTSPTSASAFLFFGGIFYRNPIGYGCVC